MYPTDKQHSQRNMEKRLNKKKENQEKTNPLQVVQQNEL